jgi:hypothetical protein
MSEFHNPATATLEEARHVVELIRKSLRYASGEDHADLSYDLATWERVVARLDVDLMQPPDPEPIANETASGYLRRLELVTTARARMRREHRRKSPCCSQEAIRFLVSEGWMTAEDALDRAVLAIASIPECPYQEEHERDVRFALGLRAVE